MSVLQLVPLVGRHVTLEPLRTDHVDGVAAAGSGDRSTFEWTEVPDGHEHASRYVAMLLSQSADGQAGPFVQRRNSDGLLVGCTRYLSPLWPLGRSEPDEVEVGGTWLTNDAQRSPINTEAKLLLLTHAFEHWNVQRVAICTDARNERSREAIDRMGATFEGVMRRHRRSHRPADGERLRDTATYSVSVDEWPGVEQWLRHRLAR